jgi:hypothetical protein
MRKLGCLVILILIGWGVYSVMGVGGMSDEEKGRWLGQKAHRGWQHVQRMVEGAKTEWDEKQRQQKKPADLNSPEAPSSSTP